jgi:hypothetical protein
MPGKNTAAFGIYPDEASLRNGVEALRREGFRAEDISVLFPENTTQTPLLMRRERKDRKTPLRRAPGSGGVRSWLAGVGSIATPDREPFLAAGPIMAIHCYNSEWTSKAKDILERTGADDIASTGETSSKFRKSNKPRPRPHV